MGDQRTWRTLSPGLVCLLSLAALLVLGWLLARATATAPGGVPLRSLPGFRLWAFLAAASMLGWVAIAWALGRAGQAWRPRTILPRWTPPMLYALLVILVYLLGREFLIEDLLPPLPGALTWRIRLFFGFAAITTGPVVLGLWYTYARVRELKGLLADPDAAARIGMILSELNRAKSYSQRCLTAFAAIIFLAVTTTGVLRKTLLAAGYPPGQFTASRLVLLGVLLSALVMLVHIPMMLTWRACEARVVDVAYPLPETGPRSEEWFTGRRLLDRFLRGEQTVGQQLMTALKILGPVAGSLLGLIFPEIKSG